ncbi:hypothetical protein CAEBREN_09517 [Caenorhabditis brenneri]|uniref:Uncharacterized protein n=1 Tax=Caenorhabditis brenneri TaxID=135651 RepID=G0MAQ0_CAEBE|nr:hypothetical protein CAEBREN_09517 [Caenorhabditis brenneri]
MYLFTTNAGYQQFLTTWGREATLLGTYTYLIALVITVLMSINRVAVVISPFNTWFTDTKVFIYCGLISIVLLISLIIPYLGPCYITFMVDKQGFISACAPSKHPVSFKFFGGVFRTLTHEN